MYEVWGKAVERKRGLKESMDKLPEAYLDTKPLPIPFKFECSIRLQKLKQS